jgi:predicted PolB exonuclease-like 3'-5' exonuclease
MMFGFPILVFDIETISDVKAGSHLYQLDLAADAALEALNKIRRQETGSDVAALPLHAIVCISGLWIDEDKFQLFSWSQEQYSEAELLLKFTQIFEKKQPILVSWNGTQFDLPVLMYRCLYHGITAASLFEQGEWDSQKRYNNYQNRYLPKHTDLMDVLAGFNHKQFQKLDFMARLMGYPGKLGIGREQVATWVQQQHWNELGRYAETDVLNTWLLYLRWLLLRGLIHSQQHQHWIRYTITQLTTMPQHAAFLAAWQNSCLSTAFSAHDFNFDRA